jgi:hypothetical protein
MGIIAMANKQPCQTTFMARSTLRTPKYWATKVLVYPQIPAGKQVTDQNKVPADMAAAAAPSEYWNKKSRSTNKVIENNPVESINGQAVLSSSLKS